MQIDRRTSRRLQVNLRCHVAVAGRPPLGWMRTQDISRDGILLRWAGAPATLPRVGDRVTVEIELPRHHAFRPRCMHCQTTVLRVTPGQPGAHLVALRVNFMDFREIGAAPPRLLALEGLPVDTPAQ
ncbi:MAG TPA: PilZ domain-containing protein [Bryobacteraceae bacterium]|nr:PilZ domain-containing protein [Bryobacteraceae bacterium]